MKSARILMADDHPEVFERVVPLLEKDFDLVGTFANGRDLLAAAEWLHPDVVILDISMPILDGIETAIQLQTSHADAKVIFLTVNDRIEFVRACFAAGANGYVIKGGLTTELIPAIHEVLAGHTFISPSLRADDSQTRKENRQ